MYTQNRHPSLKRLIVAAWNCAGFGQNGLRQLAYVIDVSYSGGIPSVRNFFVAISTIGSISGPRPPMPATKLMRWHQARELAPIS